MTVLELTIAASLMLVVLAPVLMFVATTQRNETETYNATNQQADTRLALTNLNRLLTQAEYPAGTTYLSTNSTLFLNSTTSEITFYSEPYAGQADNSNNGMIYRVDITANSSGTLVETLTAPVFNNGTGTYAYTGTQTQATLLTDIRNLNPTSYGCRGFGSSVAMFTYYAEDPGTGSLTQVTSSTSSSQINYVQMTVLTGLAGSSDPNCTEEQMSMSLRNWRP
jgi:type II secretory pathway component PulJ